jgi:hypothetical protein
VFTASNLRNIKKELVSACELAPIINAVLMVCRISRALWYESLCAAVVAVELALTVSGTVEDVGADIPTIQISTGDSSTRQESGATKPLDRN